MSSTQIVYIPNLFGGQSIRIGQVNEQASILASSFESSEFTLGENSLERLNSSNGYAPSMVRRDSESSTSTSASYIPDDAF
jgi:hypothetical protein